MKFDILQFHKHKPSVLLNSITLKNENFLIRFELAGEREGQRERSQPDSCLYLNCSALRLLNLVMRLDFIEPLVGWISSLPVSVLDDKGNARPPCPLAALFSWAAGEM